MTHRAPRLRHLNSHLRSCGVGTARRGRGANNSSPNLAEINTRQRKEIIKLKMSFAPSTLQTFLHFCSGSRRLSSHRNSRRCSSWHAALELLFTSAPCELPAWLGVTRRSSCASVADRSWIAGGSLRDRWRIAVGSSVGRAVNRRRIAGGSSVERWCIANVLSLDR